MVGSSTEQSVWILPYVEMGSLRPSCSPSPCNRVMSGTWHKNGLTHPCLDTEPVDNDRSHRGPLYPDGRHNTCQEVITKTVSKLTARLVGAGTGIQVQIRLISPCAPPCCGRPVPLAHRAVYRLPAPTLQRASFPDPPAYRSKRAATAPAGCQHADGNTGMDIPFTL